MSTAHSMFNASSVVLSQAKFSMHCRCCRGGAGGVTPPPGLPAGHARHSARCMAGSAEGEAPRCPSLRALRAPSFCPRHLPAKHHTARLSWQASRISPPAPATSAPSVPDSLNACLLSMAPLGFNCHFTCSICLNVQQLYIRQCCVGPNQLSAAAAQSPRALPQPCTPMPYSMTCSSPARHRRTAGCTAAQCPGCGASACCAPC